MEKEIKAIIEKEFKKLSNRPEEGEKELEERLTENQIENEKLEVTCENILVDKIVKEYLIKELNIKYLMKPNCLKKHKKNDLE